ncbi:hypothetical protein ACTXG6_45800 [Pseudonocardia sp. Cha107L01]|uniref:hypothetical protein n=1 Tax=Pseudonocardia sp. Cha107L01 TaxID=3457576 RepID=UPI00403EC84E
MKGTCVACARQDALEDHHVAGRANDPLSVDACLECHRDYLTPWQRASGVALQHGSVRTDVDRLRALAVGLFDVLALFAQRHASSIPRAAADSATLAGRGWSRLLDLRAPPDRPGRWTPNPGVPQSRADALPAKASGEKDQLAAVGGLTRMAAQVNPLDQTGAVEDGPLHSLVTAISADPTACLAGIEAVLTDHHTYERADTLLTAALASIVDAADTLLTLDDPVTVSADPEGALAEATRELLGCSVALAELLSGCLPLLSEGAGA